MFLQKNGFVLNKKISYPNNGSSLIFTSENQAVIIDQNICKAQIKEIFPYSLITNTQNRYMHNYKKVWRLLEEDFQNIFQFLNFQNHDEQDFKISRNINREDNAELSPLEFYFEEQFKEVYGEESVKFLNKEFAINDESGNSYFLDYLIHTKNGDFGIEENGISYHHPQVIGLEKYRKQLQKQNTCTAWGIKLFRFSTEDCQNKSRIQDTIREYFGKDTSAFKENGLIVDRKIKLYEHQKNTLEQIQQERKSGTKSFLVVFPTASGKSKIIEEDIKAFEAELKNQGKAFRALILAPNTNIIADWKNRIEENLSNLASNIKICSFASIERNYTIYSQIIFPTS